MLAQIRQFLVALEEGSLNRAATRLRMSQSALSRQMQALEHELGGALLERTASGVRPTDAGHALAKAMPRVLTDFEAALAETRRIARGQRELLRIGYLGSAAQVYLDPALSAFRRAQPTAKVALLDLSPGEQIAALRRGEIDLALTGQEGGFAAREFYTRKLVTLPVFAVLPAEHPLASRQKIQLAELKGECFLSSPEADMPGRDRWITQLCRRAGFRPQFVQEAESVSRLFTLVSSEGAVCLVPAYFQKMLSAGIALVPLADDFARWDFLVVWQRGKASTLLRAFLEQLAATVDGVCSTLEAKEKTNG